jgi:hypothetical protein
MQDKITTHPGLGAIHKLIEAESRKAGGMRALARKWKVSASYISDILGWRRHPGPSILNHLDLIAIRRVTVEYVRKGKK